MSYLDGHDVLGPDAGHEPRGIDDIDNSIVSIQNCLNRPNILENQLSINLTHGETEQPEGFQPVPPYGPHDACSPARSSSREAGVWPRWKC